MSNYSKEITRLINNYRIYSIKLNSNNWSTDVSTKIIITFQYIEQIQACQYNFCTVNKKISETLIILKCST